MALRFSMFAGAIPFVGLEVRCERNLYDGQKTSKHRELRTCPTEATDLRVENEHLHFIDCSRNWAVCVSCRGGPDERVAKHRGPRSRVLEQQPCLGMEPDLR